MTKKLKGLPNETTRSLVEAVAATKGSEAAARALFTMCPHLDTITIGELHKGDAKTYHRKDFQKKGDDR